MEVDLFITLSVIIVVATIVSAIMRLLRQPLIIGYILTGVLVGPSFLHLIPDKAPFEAFSNIGITLLLFIIGLGLSATVIQRLGKVVLATAAVQIILSALAGYAAAIFLGFSQIESLIVGLALTFSSTIIIIKLITDRREQTRLFAQASIGILLVQDLVASAALVLLAASSGDGLSLEGVGLLLAKGAILAALLILVGGKLLPKLSCFIASSQEFLFLFALAWGFGISTLFELAGLSIEVGALFAGVSIAALPYAQEVAARLKPLRDFFVVVFFIALGEGLQLNNLGPAIGPALIFSLIVVFIKPLFVLSTMGIMGYTKRTSFKTAISLSQISEFSLVFAVLATSQGLINETVSTIITLVAIITIAVSTYLMKYDNKIFSVLSDGLRLFERKKVKDEGQHLESYPIILFGYHKGGEEFIKSFRALDKRYVVVDYDPEVIEEMEHQRIANLYGDATDLEFLKELNVEKTKLVVTTIMDHQTTVTLVRYTAKKNPKAIIICYADNYSEAAELYKLGATYVMLPHLVGSEKISSFIKKAGLRKREFAHYRNQHLMLLEKKIQD